MKTLANLAALAASCGRPLVFLDFETSALKGNPCEVAMVVLSPGSPVQEDESLAFVRAELERPSIACGPVNDVASLGLCYAVAGRLNPGQPMSPGARSTHGISDADVASCPRYDDPQIVDLFRGIEATNPIWIGHNVASYDLPLAVRCGYLSKPPHPGADIIDTLRWAKARAENEPFPPCFDSTSADPLLSQVVPAAEYGLGVFRSDLSSLHVAVCGWPFEGAHGALADVAANIRVFARMLDLWADIDRWAQETAAPPNHARLLAAALATFDQPGASQIGHSGWLRRVIVDGVTSIEWAKGKMAGEVFDASRDASYVSWVLSTDDLDHHTRAFLTTPTPTRRRR